MMTLQKQECVWSTSETPGGLEEDLQKELSKTYRALRICECSRPPASLHTSAISFF